MVLMGSAQLRPAAICTPAHGVLAINAAPHESHQGSFGNQPVPGLGQREHETNVDRL